MKIRTLIATAAATLMAFSLTACGSNSSDRPSKDAVVNAMLSSQDQVKKIEAQLGKGKARELAQCIMDASYDKLSTTTLTTLTQTKGNVPNKPEDVKLMMNSAKECVATLAPDKVKDPKQTPATPASPAETK
ncbi:hypothetical protein [Arcanobacterium canis]